MDPFSPTVAEVANFLADQFKEGKSYRTINVYRSMLSSSLAPVDNYQVGQHPVIVKVMTGARVSRPPEPRYSSTWDVNVVTSYLKSLPGELNLIALSKKLVMLLALCSANRIGELAALDLEFECREPDGIRFVLPVLTKTQRSGPSKEVFFPSFPSDPLLCPVSCIELYKEKTQDIRERLESRRLLITAKKPHRPVSTATIARWIKDVLQASGIDISTFKAHSTRGAATSAAKAAGVSGNDILKTASWTSESTFNKFYYRPRSSSVFARGALGLYPRLVLL